MSRFKPLPSQEVLNELLSYDRDTGIFTHKVRPLSYFSCKRIQNSWNTRHAGTVAGFSCKGYVILVLLGSNYGAHRVAWAMVYGIEADKDIDHIDTCGSNNRIANLRLADKSDNMHNVNKYSTNTSSQKNVSWDDRRKTWTVNITDKGRHYSFGSYRSLEEATRVAQQARNAFLGEFANHGSDGVGTHPMETGEGFARRIKATLDARLLVTNKSGKRGVVVKKGKFVARARKNKKDYQFGTFATLEEAAEAARLGRIKLGLEK
jgi:hypothetical protein